ELELALRTGGGWQALYRFTPQAQHWLDYLPRNWFTSTHPDSVFRKGLRVALSEGDTRLTLLDGQFGWRDAQGSSGQRRIASADELIELLRGRFRLGLPPATAEALVGRLKVLI
ncbi:arylamine N-acetyltransferase, partial [Pseudomonas citronellolis]|uniref:arylamine N-acetyltransferase n=1 Tax=Pseudomonas citronellolis TaxID=53408 RepID=UPI0023E43DC4